MNLHKLRYPFLFGVPGLKQVAALAGLLSREPRGWPADMPVMGLFLSLDPPIFCCQPRPWPFGVAHHLAARFPDEPFVFLAPITMSLERKTNALTLSVKYRRFRKAHPRTSLILLANTRAEEALLQRLGVDVQYAPQNMFVDEGMYYPVPGRERQFDAIYNAQLAPFKRHELARAVPSCAYVTKMFSTWAPLLKREQLRQFLRVMPAGHAIINDIVDDDFTFMDHVQVNEAMALAHVGLCLSRLEGAMYASVEYLLAGLPVVSTRSQGGRDIFFHPDTALIVDDDPRAVQDGVAAMKARAVPPEHVRATTLRLMAEERERFNNFVDGLRGRSAERTDPRWSFTYAHKLARFGRLSEFEALLLGRRFEPEPAGSD
jgi:glycosyltransferase involved in cell wall biosynthesis